MRIQNRHYRECARAGWRARLSVELTGEVPAQVPLYSHHATRQSYFEKGWRAVTALDVAKAQCKQQQE